MRAVQVVAQTTRQAWVTALGGVLAGMLLVPMVLISSDRVAEYWDRTHPVATGEAKLLLREPDAVEYELTAKRLRGSCQFVRIVPYAVTADGQRRELNARRLDGPERGVSHPPGVVFGGRWRVWPTEDSRRIEVIASYLCGDRLNFARVGVLEL